MPHRTRIAMRQQAKIIREVGETVWLLTSTRDTSSRAVPFSIVDSDEPQTTTDKTQAIYAFVEWHTDEVVYDEAGHAHNLSATVTANIQYRAALQACYAVRFSDGSVLRKTDEALSDERTSYAILVAGEANVVNL